MKEQVCPWVQPSQWRIRSAFFQHRQAVHLCPYFYRKSLTTLIHVLIISRINYSFYIELALKMVQKLQQVQNTPARLVKRTSKWDHISCVLVHLHWLLVCFWAKFKVPILTFKALNSLEPCYLSECLSLRMTAKPTHTSYFETLQVATQREAFSWWLPCYGMPS